MRSVFYISFAALIALSSCKKAEPVPEPVIRPVVTFEVPESNGKVKRSFSGVVDSVKGASIAFEVGGRVVEVNATEGLRYEQGAVLARLDTREFQNQLDAANAQLVEARQSLRRSQQLVETGNASQSALESAIARERAAQSNYNSARKVFEDAVLKMPYSGVIGSVSIDPQMVIAAGQTVMTIQGEGGKEFQIGVPANLIGRFSVGMKSQIKMGSLPDAEFAATVDSISPEVGQNTTYPVILSFESDDERIREGLDGEATLSLPNPNGDTLAVPSTCVAKVPHAEVFVWIVKPVPGKEGYGTVSRRQVTPGNLREDGMIEIVSGVAPGDVIVARGVHRIEENQEVKLHSKQG
ncbi:MAG: efflux RND transporter periplasmic adaptor subunit [Verrucomicrobiales bacterium]|nr:efflux RND transporter periplasmic adaptor subunit [Verrucomicrobiales bacterium]